MSRMSLPHGEPAFVDEHHVLVAARARLSGAPCDVYADSSLLGTHPVPLTRVLGTEPPSGFGVAEEVPNEQLRLAGRHRFSRYQLVFELSDDAVGTTLLSARTFADFPGLHGRVYRALVIGSGAHVLAVRHMLRSVRSSSAT